MITMIKRTHWLSLLSLLASFIFLVLPVAAQQSPAPAPSELEELKGKVKILTDEVDSLKTKLVLPETAELKSLYGLGPAASKIYQLGRGLSIGGYGETNFSLLIDDKGTGKNIFDFVRFVLYAGYKFTDRILLNAEI